MKRTLAFLYFFVMTAIVVKAQYTEMAGKPYNQRIEDIHRLYDRVVGKPIDRQALADTLKGMRTLARRIGDKELFLEADLLDAYYDFRIIPNKFMSKRLVKLEQVLHKGLQENILPISSRAAFVLARHYWDAQQYEKAFEGYFRLDSILQQQDVTDFPDKAHYLEEMGSAYYHFADYDKAITHFRRVASLPRNDIYINSWRHALNNMGLSYQKLNQLSRSDSCFLQLAKEVKGKSQQWEGIVAGNLGYNHYLRGDYLLAIPFLETDIRIAEAYKDVGLAAGSTIPMADILLQQSDFAGSKHYLDKSLAYIHDSGQTDRLRLLYPVMSKWYMATGKHTEADQYLDSALIAVQQYNEKFSALRLLRANLEAVAHQKEALLQKQRADSEKQLVRRNLMVSVLIVLLILLVFFAYRQRKTAELRLKNNDLKLLKAERDLQDAQQQLEALARTAASKEQEIQQLEEQSSTENRQLIEQLAQQVVLTEEGWQRFSELFGKVYPGFQHTLKSKHPALTPAEIRCLAMEKLRFTNKEMAALQGISTNAVMVTKHRIRKKLGLLSQQELEQLISDT